MKLPSATGGNFSPAPEGTFQALCTEIIDLGTQPQSYLGEEKEPARMIRIGWQLVSEHMDDGRPFAIGKDYTFSMGKKANFRKHLESWIPPKVMEAAGGLENFDIKDLLNKGCLLSVQHYVNQKGDTGAKISGVSSLVKGMQKPAPIADPLYFSLEKTEYAEDAWARVPDWLRDKIKKSPEYLALTAPKTVTQLRTVRQPGGMSAVHAEQPASSYDPDPDMDDEIPF